MMTNLSASESLFMEKRSRLARHWPWVGSALLVLLFALTVWLWISVPHLIDPWSVSAGLQAGTLPETSIVLMASMLPIVMLALLASVAVTVIFSFVAFSNERRWLRIVQRQVVATGSAADERR